MSLLSDIPQKVKINKKSIAHLHTNTIHKQGKGVTN
jgi:hypothetical protein